MNRKTLGTRAAVVLLLAMPAAHAEELVAKQFTLRGFGTVAATTQNAEGLEFRRSTAQLHGVEANEIELYTDSLAGVQFNAKLSPKFDVVLQGLSRQRSDGNWNMEMSQGFVRFSPDESWVLRAGRVSYDIYLLAESRQVGYSYLPLRQPPELYGLVSNDAFDGGDVAYTRRLGPGLARARVFGGKGSADTAFADGSHSEGDADVYGACFDYLYRGWTARLALVQYSTAADPSFAQLAAGLRMTGGAQALSLAESLEAPKLTFEAMQLGIAYEDGPLQAQMLYGAIDSDSLSGPDTYHLYSLFGYRVRAFTPYASIALSRDREPMRPTGLPDIPMFAPLNYGVAAIQSTYRLSQHTSSVGLRYDFSSHVDFKFQVDRVHMDQSSLTFDRRMPGGGPAYMTVVAAAIDFVF